MKNGSQGTVDMPLSELLRSLKPGQFWSALTACIAVIGGSWFFGYWVSEQSANFDLRSKDQIITELRSNLSDASEDKKEIKFLNKKIRLLSLLVLFNEASERRTLALEAIERDPETEGVEENYLAEHRRWTEVGDNILQFVRELDEEMGAAGSSAIQMRLGKGISKQTITFLQDGSVWPLPSILFATAN